MIKNNLQISSFVADTHCFIWHLTGDTRMEGMAKHAFERADRGEIIIYLSVITPIELLYLYEKQKISRALWSRFSSVFTSRRTDSYQVVDLTYDLAKWIKDVPRKIIPDLPDRIIAATALSYNLPLITRDHKIREWGGIKTVWSI
ncbi:MAG: PIN domain-containing protein [Deltaproteobacteria bacterium]|nr:PIN domain-containing protein [Deltaproteobacteria bacterium]